MVLLDCGDGSIRNLLKFGVNVNEISKIMITHYHSDHLSGLTQVIETMGIRSKTSDLFVYGPPGLKDYFSTVQKITNVASHRKFEVKLIELGINRHFELTDQVSVETFQMDHTIPCLGYRLEISKDLVIAYTGDTMPCPALPDLGRDADLFVHEATYLEKDREKARPPKHSTAKEAAIAAKSAHAKKLVMSHVADDYETPYEMTREARVEFSNAEVAFDGMVVDLG